MLGTRARGKPKARKKVQAVPKSKTRTRALARAREGKKKTRLLARREACVALNALARECEVGKDKTLQKRRKDFSSPEKVHKLIRLLEPACATAGKTEELRAAAQKWQENGGTLVQLVTETQ